MSAPELIWSELANVCVKKNRARPDEARPIFEAYQRRGALNLETFQVDTEAVVRLALTSGLSAYDARYLWLSRRRGLELVTLDKRLAAAAETSA